MLIAKPSTPPKKAIRLQVRKSLLVMLLALLTLFFVGMGMWWVRGLAVR